MGLQKYRADIADAPCENGSVAWRTEWMGGRTLALIRNCEIETPENTPPRTVYVTGEADTYFSVPARCKIAGKTVIGWIGRDDGRGWYFRANKTQV